MSTMVGIAKLFVFGFEAAMRRFFKPPFLQYSRPTGRGHLPLRGGMRELRGCTGEDESSY